MFIPISEVPSKFLGSGEERHYFKFYERDRDLPLEIVITRLPPFFSAGKNWHKHDFIEEFSVPLSGEIVIKEKIGEREVERIHKQEIIRDGEWVIGISCKSDKQATLHIDSAAGNRREVEVDFDPEYSEGKDLHKVENPTDAMVTMVTLKRVSQNIFAKDPLVFRVDRIPSMEDR